MMTLDSGTPRRWMANTVILIAVAVLGVTTLAGNSESRKTRQTLEYNALRGDCIRDVQGDYNRQLYADIADLLKVGRDPAKFSGIVKRMEAKAKVNYADVVLRECAPAVEGETPTTATTKEKP